MGVPEEKLAGVDQALADLGKSDAEVTEVRARFTATTAVDLKAVDGELSGLSDGVPFESESAEVHTERAPVREEPEASWENESTEVEIIDESDFVLLVDESDLEALEKVGEDDALQTTPAAPPDDEEEVAGEGSFFKKLFGGRRSSSSP